MFCIISRFISQRDWSHVLMKLSVCAASAAAIFYTLDVINTNVASSVVVVVVVVDDDDDLFVAVPLLVCW